MGKEELLARILSDAENEAEAIVTEAKDKAEEILSSARARVSEISARSAEETARECEALKEGKRASARLDGAKVRLKEKRRVLDEIYARAGRELLALPKKETLELFSALLEKYAETGDEVVVSGDFAYVQELKKLPVFVSRKLKLTAHKNSFGGLLLKGKTSDVDLSFAALLKEDREREEAEIAQKLFRA